MANGVWKGVCPQFFGRFRQLSLNKFFDLSTPSMRKGRDGGTEKTEKKGGGEREKKKRRMKIVATTSLLAVDRPNTDRWNAARSRQKWKMAARGPQKGRRGLERSLTLGFWPF